MPSSLLGGYGEISGLGRIVGSKKLEAKGHARELEGRIQKGVGNLKESAEDALSDTTRKSNR